MVEVEPNLVLYIYWDTPLSLMRGQFIRVTGNGLVRTCMAMIKPLRQWMKDGDPELAPILMADARSTAASYFGVSARAEGQSASFTEQQASPITPEMIAQCCRETGIQLHCSLGSATHLDAIDFIHDVEMTVRQEAGTDAILKYTTIRTPAGEMTDTFVTPAGRPAYWADHLVKSEADLPALLFLIERAAQVSLEDDRVRRQLTAKFRAEAAKWPAETLFYAVLGVPAFSLTCNLYMDPTLAFFLLLDHPAEMERMFQAYEQANAVWMECAVAGGADFTHGAINGLELFSPDIYQRYFIPQARRLHEAAHSRGMLGWVHTCGQMQRLIEMGVYEEMAVDVLESLSSPPLGDIADLHSARARLGDRLVTRGGVNVDYFYDADPDTLRAETHRVLAETRGRRHMIGDTNDSFPPYPRENILTLVDEVRKSGRMLAYSG